MGMVGCFAAVDRKILEQLRTDPEGLEDYLFPNDGEGNAPNSIDIDKSWHGIHYLLTGTAYGGEEPLSLAILGGEEIGEDLGYGPARFLTPEQVKAVAAALRQLSPEELRRRYRPEAMEKAGIYPPKAWASGNAEELEYLVKYFQDLLSYYADASTRGDAMILWLG